MNESKLNEIKLKSIEMFQSGSDKNEIGGFMFTSDIEFVKIPNLMVKWGIKFTRESNKWDQFTSYFKSENQIEKSELIKKLQSDFEWSEKDAKKYTSSYFKPMSEIQDYFLERIETGTDSES